MVALWVTKPTAEQRRGEITREGVTVRFECVALREIPASLLLADPRTVCFAAAADGEGLSDTQLCTRVARALREHDASYREQHVAVAVAMSTGRYSVMIRAMASADFEPLVIEEFVRFGVDQGFEKGLAAGLEKGLAAGLEKGRAEALAEALDQLRAALLELVVARGLQLESEHRARLQDAHDFDTLRTWIARAGRAQTASEIFGDEAEEL